MKSNIDDEAFEALGEIIQEEKTATIAANTPSSTWSPSLGATQQKIFDSSAKWMLAHGNKGGGKSFIFGHKLVRHCYENRNALALIIVGVRSMATQGGIWDKLDTEILPAWKRGIGLDYKEPRMDEQRYRYRFIRNMHGGFSKIVLMSLSVGSMIKDRIKGFEPSIVFVDELITLDEEFFSAVTQQIGRRPGISGPQQYLAATNPDGPSHWVYKRFFELPFEEAKDDVGNIISPAGEWDTRYEVHHLQMSENKKHLPPGYYESVIEGVRNDPVEQKRMVDGVWVDRPTGKAIFKDFFYPDVHMMGDLIKKRRIMPSINFPIIIGYDLGAANNAIVFLQAITVREVGVVWVCFDEMVYVNKKIEYKVLVRELVKRMNFWNKTLDHVFRWIHISDNSAFNQYRATTGSYDVLDVERFSKKTCKVYHRN